jgi:hypothetical protein
LWDRLEGWEWECKGGNVVVVVVVVDDQEKVHPLIKIR